MAPLQGHQSLTDDHSCPIQCQWRPSEATKVPLSANTPVALPKIDCAPMKTTIAPPKLNGALLEQPAPF